MYGRIFFEFFDISRLFVIACTMRGERVSVQIAFWARAAVSSVRPVTADSAHGRQRGDTSGSSKWIHEITCCCETSDSWAKMFVSKVALLGRCIFVSVMATPAPFEEYTSI